MSNKDYDNKALLYAEKYGIPAYEQEGNEMTYWETFTMEGMRYKATVNLDTMKETRKGFPL
jgi:hypothetical protein